MINEDYILCSHNKNYIFIFKLENCKITMYALLIFLIVYNKKTRASL